jgi:hypothetical protein
MCANCDTNIVNEVMEALDPIFESFGEQEVLDIIHDYYHNRHRKDGTS